MWFKIERRVDLCGFEYAYDGHRACRGVRQFRNLHQPERGKHGAGVGEVDIASILRCYYHRVSYLDAPFLIAYCQRVVALVRGSFVKKTAGLTRSWLDQSYPVDRARVAQVGEYRRLRLIHNRNVGVGGSNRRGRHNSFEGRGYDGACLLKEEDSS